MRARGSALFVAVFLAGAVLLGVEIAASRVLAPFFGNSLFVWGALIGVVLSGLATGYWVGGVLADRYPTPLLRLSVLVLGAAGVLAIPLLDEPVLEAVVSWDPGPRLDPVLAAVLLFGAPSVVLAASTPIAVRLRARDLGDIGHTAGRLFSVSTIGSIAGTFVTAFWLVPELGTDQMLAIGAAVLFAAATLLAFAERLVPAGAVALAATAGAVVAAIALAPETGGTLSAAAARNWSPVYRLRGDVKSLPPVDYTGDKIVFRKDSRYHRIAVVEGAGRRTLRFGSSYQSEMELRDPFSTAYQYTDFFFLGPAYNPDARNILFLGLGGGSAIKRLWRDLPNVRLNVVELDPTVVDVAHRFFAVPKTPRINIDVEDARRALARDDRRWDVIAIDTYFEDGIPFHLATQEFLELAHKRLKPDGVIVANIIGAPRGPGSKLFRAFYRTYRTVFPTVLVHPVTGVNDGLQNVILVATDQAAPSKDFLRERWREILRKHPSAPDLARAITLRYDGVLPTRDVPTLTDDYAPSDSLLLAD
jgi:spermidine synthase